MTRKGKVTKLDGFCKDLESDPPLDFSSVRWVEGEDVLLAEWTEDDARISLRLESTNGRDYEGTMTSPDWDEPTATQLTKWVSPDGNEWLLVGSFETDEGPKEFAIEVFVP